MKQINITDIIAPNYLKKFNDKKTMHQILLSGRASTKTSFDCIKIAFNMINETGMEVVVIRQKYKDHKDSTFRELIKAFARLGVYLKPKVNYPLGNDLYIEYNGNYIHFKGFGNSSEDLDSLLGLTMHDPVNNKIKLIYFFEYRQFKFGTYGTNQVISTFSRGNPDWFICIWESNPHQSATHWSYDFRDTMRERDDAWILSVNYNDLPERIQREWLGPIMLNEIENTKKFDYEQYKHIYLGLPAKLDGAIYKQFNVNKQVSALNIDRKQAAQYHIGVDYGNKDATTFYLVAFNKGYRGIRVLKEYYHKNGLSEGSKDVNDYSKDLLNFVNKCYNMVKVPITIWIDPAADDFYNVSERYLQLRAPDKCIVNKSPSGPSYEIEHRIAVMNLMLGADFIKIDESCTYLIKAIDLAEYNKHGKRLDNTTTHFTDALDAFEYSWIHEIDLIRDIVLQGLQYKE